MKNLKEKINKLCIGTVKFGDPSYGHSSEHISSKNINNFIKNVVDIGIRRFDTSPRYGNSEVLLGDFIKNEKMHSLIIGSKIDNLKSNDTNSKKAIFDSVYSSLKKLNIEYLDYCYLHQSDFRIISDKYIHDALFALKQKGLVRKIGVSIYSFEECKYSIKSKAYDIIQLPINAIDSSIYNKLVKNDNSQVEFSARSILFQGMIANRENIRNKVSKDNYPLLIDHLSKIDKIAEEYKYETYQLALAFIFSLKNINHFIVGTTSHRNIIKNIEIINNFFSKEAINKIKNLSKKYKPWSDLRTI